MLDDPPTRDENSHATDIPVRGRSGVPWSPATRIKTATLLVAVVGAAMIGAGAVTGLLFAAGAFDGSTKPATVVESVAASGASGSSASFDPKALYKASAAGVVDITAHGVGSSDQQASPFAPPDQSPSTASGTGSVIDAQGRVLTASHVVEGASAVKVRLQDGTTRSAKVLGEDRSTDVALLKIDPAGLTLHPLALGSSTALAVGDPLAVIGDPLQYARSLSTGIVSGLDRTIQAPSGFSVAHAIQTDASLNPGNSGGPVLDKHGRVVGIADQIATGGAGASGLGFAVPIDVVKSELSQLEHGSQVTHAYLGASTTEASDQQGAVVEGVRRNSPADKAGLRTGDAVTAVDGKKIGGSNDLIGVITSRRPGDRVSLTVQRGSDHLNLKATLGTQPRQAGRG